MSEAEVGRVLLEDVNANMTMIILLALLACGALALVGAVLAARAGAMLHEARALYADIESLRGDAQSVTQHLHSSHRTGMQYSMGNHFANDSRKVPVSNSRRII